MHVAVILQQHEDPKRWSSCAKVGCNGVGIKLNSRRCFGVHKTWGEQQRHAAAESGRVVCSC